MKKKLLFVFAAITLLGITAFTVSRSSYTELSNNKPTQKCTDEGRERKGSKPLTAEEKEFNKRKNKNAAVPEGNPKSMKLEQLLQGRTKVNDSADWKEGTYVEIADAYLIDFKQQKGESCNCYDADKDITKGDIHINIGNQRSLTEQNNNYYMVVEITPSYKKSHSGIPDMLKGLKKSKVTIRGYLFYDSEHERNSVNYCQQCTDKGVWRKTCWEIHPVTFIGKSN